MIDYFEEREQTAGLQDLGFAEKLYQDFSSLDNVKRFHFYCIVLTRPDEEEEQLARKREERRLQSLQRKHERKLKHDEIRKKYGLLQDSDNPYSRFENE
ncbi:hypothetical protein BTVI_30502 [Pitangus sulphuratus]|nr:hypothetical protein BTVI_30502 [Pitangus sulphuratus]